MTATRKFKNTPIDQGEDEIVAYTVDTSVWPGTGDPGTITVVIKDRDGTDQTATNLSGSASNSGDVITTPVVTGLKTGGSPYQLEVQWVKQSNTLEAWGKIVVSE